MRKRTTLYTIEDCRQKAAEKGGECLSTKYENCAVSMKWRCSEGHEWKTGFKHIKEGTWCKFCNKKRDKIEDLHVKALENGGFCLDDKYINTFHLYKWKCSIGHVWKAEWHSVKRNVWCPGCIGRMDTIEDLHNLAITRKGRCLSNVYYTSNHKYDWMCENKHTWKAKWTKIKGGNWCPKCFYLSLRVTIDDCKYLASKNDGFFIDSEYTDVFRKHKWQCKEGHIWIANYNSIRNGHWCPSCRVLKWTIEDMHVLAKKRGGKFLDANYRRTKDRHNFECEKGHTWNTQVLNVLSGKWCPECKKSKGEKKVQNCLEVTEVIYTTQKQFKGCENLEGKALRFDFFLPEYNVAIEYDGQQHFVLVDYFGGLEGFQKRIHHDAIKSNYCEQNDITLIRVAFDEDLETVLAERLERSFDEKFVMWVQISPEYENQVEAIFGKERYQTFKLGDVEK